VQFNNTEISILLETIHLKRQYQLSCILSQFTSWNFYI